MYVSKIMNHNVYSCKADDTLETAAGKMWNYDLGCLPVLDKKGEIVGMITDRDICMAAYTRGLTLNHIPVSMAMSQDLHFCKVDDTIKDAEEKMISHRVRRLPVLDGKNQLVGIVALSDLAQEAEREIDLTQQEITPRDVTDTLAAVSQPRGFQIGTQPV